MTDYNYKLEDSGLYGKTFERDLKAEFGRRAFVAAPGKTDFRRYRKNFEVKTGAGELGNISDSHLIKGASLVIYVPVVDMKRPIEAQEGFILERETFLECIERAGLLRTKVSTAGTTKVTIQTFWNHKQNKPHGKKLFELLDLLYENSLMTLQDFFQEEGKVEVEG